MELETIADQFHSIEIIHYLVYKQSQLLSEITAKYISDKLMYYITSYNLLALFNPVMTHSVVNVSASVNDHDHTY